MVVQSSTDDAETFTPISVVNPGYPDGGADEGDVTVAPNGALDVLYQGYDDVNPRTLRLAVGHEYFATSTDGGRSWSAPVEVGASAGQITIDEWWNDGSVATDSAGDLYATWDTQGKVGGRRTDTGWVSYSTDGGHRWSAPVQANPDDRDVPHITEVTGAGPGQAYVAWLSSSNPLGYALYLRTFSISAGGWLSDAAQISRQFGNRDVFPGDTFGLATFSPTALAAELGQRRPPLGPQNLGVRRPGRRALRVTVRSELPSPWPRRNSQRIGPNQQTIPPRKSRTGLFRGFSAAYMAWSALDRSPSTVIPGRLKVKPMLTVAAIMLPPTDNGRRQASTTRWAGSALRHGGRTPGR